MTHGTEIHDSPNFLAQIGRHDSYTDFSWSHYEKRYCPVRQ
ncbi:hypothetical protein S1OALGB6SA_1475 [Olavius algarvensis spirochete endosymbiont]|nr:MAG: hypothetical protein [Olavius algarvensis spirochete endosymbiont]VDB00397.1 hypothetical protein S1OALGB6SA_1475 [Olavius algarvensis spirochete endosymbiont]